MGINIAAVCGSAYANRAILLAKRAKAGNAENAEIERERRELNRTEGRKDYKWD